MSGICRIAALALFSALLAACGGGGSGGQTSEDTTADATSTTAVSGGATKGPLANGDVEIFQLDPAAAGGRGPMIASGTTDDQARMADLRLPDETNGLLLIRFSTDADTIDLTTGQRPIIDRLATILPARDIIEDGRPVFATPFTTVVARMALVNADTADYGGNDDGTATSAEVRSALDAAASRSASMLGVGLLSGIDLRETPPILLAGVTDDAATQDAVTRYRTAIEAIGCLARNVAEAIDGANGGATTTTADAAFEALSADVTDGAIDGAGPGGPITTYGTQGADAAADVVAGNPADCVIPNEPGGRTVAETAAILTAETSATGNSGADTSGVTAPAIASGRARSNIDGDADPDGSDADIDGDGIPNADDEAPLVPEGGSTANARPSSADDSATVDEDASVTIDVLSNDDDIDGSLDLTTVTITSAAANGTTSVDAGTGAITYTPAPDFNGSDRFAYSVADEAGERSPAASVRITVNASNDIPTASNDSAAVAEDAGVVVDALANDSDVDGNLDPATVSINTAPTNGSTAVDNATGAITYTPAANFTGADSFAYTVDDDAGATSNTATVTITVTAVNDAPSATDDSASVDEDQSVTIDVLTNDNDIDGSLDAASVTVTSGPGDGTTAVNSSTGAITYTPEPDFNGADSFAYTVDDDAGTNSNTATVTITVNAVNDAPSATDDNASVDEDDSVIIDVLANDDDIDGSLDVASVTVTSGPGNGSTSVDTNTGEITYSPAPDFNGSDSFSYTVDDGVGDTSNTANVDIAVAPVNDPPSFNAGGDQTVDEEAGSQTVAGWASAVSVGPGNESAQSIKGFNVTNDNDALFSAAPAITNDGTLTYTPAADASGSADVTVTVSDDGGTANGGSDTSGQASFTVTVTPQLDLTSASVMVGAQPKTLSFAWNDDGDESVAAYRLEVNPDGTSGFSGVDMNGDGTIDADDEIDGTAGNVDITIPVHGTDFLETRYQIVALASDGSELARSDTLFLDGLTVEDLIGYFKASNTEPGDVFGTSVAVSSDGDTLAVGALGEDSGATAVNGDQNDDTAPNAGAVYVFTRDGSGNWSQQAYVKASNTDGNDQFGVRVALSRDGDTLAVGAQGEDSGATAVNGDQSDNSATNAGAVYVFARDGSGNWSQQAYVKASNTDTNDLFGGSVALSGDGDTLAVGAPREASAATAINGDQSDDTAVSAGAVYVFARDGSGNWSQQAYVKASNTGSTYIFGGRVALSGDGDTLAVGALGEDSGATAVNGDQNDDTATNAGAAYVFARDGSGNWSQQAYVKASNTDSDDQFGVSVALSGDGDTLAIGARFEASDATAIDGNQGDNTATDSGAAYVFARDGSGSWLQQAYVKASNSDSGDQFGSSVALAGDGNTLAVGARLEASAATAIDGDQGDNTASEAGAVYMFARDGSGNWSQQAYVKASNTDSGDQFNSNVDLSGDGDTLAVGARFEDGAATAIGGNQSDDTALNAGAVYLY